MKGVVRTIGALNSEEKENDNDKEPKKSFLRQRRSENLRQSEFGRD